MNSLIVKNMKNQVIIVFRMVAILFTIHYSVLASFAQDSTKVFRFGYLSYEAVLQSMPDYAIVQQQMADLRSPYLAETKRVEDEFNHKYEDFLDGQRDFPRTILQKRQTELQELMEKNIQFKEKSREELAEAERQALAPLRIRLIELLATIGSERGYAFIYDTDTKALPFINPEQGEDINELVTSSLQK